MTHREGNGSGCVYQGKINFGSCVLAMQVSLWVASVSWQVKKESMCAE